MGRSNVSLSAERMALAAFAANPNKIFDFDGIVLQDSDFSNAACQCIYNVIKDFALQQGNNAPEMDAVILEDRVSARYDNIYSAQKNEFAEIIASIKDTSPPDNPTEYVRMTVAESIRRKSKSKLYTIVEQIDQMTDPTEIITRIEKDVFDFTNATMNQVDVVNLADGYGAYLTTIAEEAKRGDVRVGLPTGFPTWDKAIGGGLRRRTINCIAARAGHGKSLIGANMAINLAKQNVPVLLMDSELDKELQMNRFAAIYSQIPISDIETGRIFTSEDKIQKITDCKNIFQNLPLDYVSIKGWTIHQQVSLIRRWMAKRVPRLDNGQYQHAVVILDYLKLLNAEDKSGSKEWEVLGYRMTALHDLMSQYGASMLLFTQQNRSGLDRDDESTVSGSDRIIWLCDNFTVLFKTPSVVEESEEEVDEIDSEYPNMGLKVSKCRHGRGTTSRHFIGIYADKEDHNIDESQVCGIFKDKGMKLLPNV